MEGYLCILVLFTCLSWLPQPGSARVLNDFIRHFEPVEYDKDSLMWHHHRVRRSIIGPKELRLNFNSFGRAFDIALKPEREFFHPNFTLMVGDRVVSKHQSKAFLYSGSDPSHPRVRAYGNLAHGVFDGTIETEDEVFHLEPALRYNSHLNKNDTFHSIIYRQSDLEFSSLSTASCGSTNSDIQKAMLHLQKSFIHKNTEEDHILRKRQQPGRNLEKVRCWLNVILDYKLFRELTGNGEDPQAVLFSIILRGSSIFESTDFNDDNQRDNIHFGILQMTIENNAPPPSDFFANDFIGVSSFLNQHSTANYSDFCLSYRFTHRDFDDGVVGLAYIAPQPGQNIAGGICQRALSFSGTLRTLNTGIVTSLNYGRRIPPSLSALTFAHEAGHNFGAQHDDGSPPAGGAFIMHAFATDGSQPNNDEFSPQSIGYIDPVIADRGQSPGGCFVEATDNCGNSLLDEGEECDCGLNYDDNGICRENSCCMGSNCTLNGDIQCSPDQGLCCNASCMFVPASENRICSMATECALEQTCSGNSFKCPDPDPVLPPDNVTFVQCAMNQSLCDGPVCNGSICIAINSEPCECRNESQACDACCQLDIGCVSTFDIAERNINGLRDLLPNGIGVHLQVGQPCANFTGNCDFLNRCFLVDENGALLRLADLFFNSDTFNATLDFISNMWWVILLIAVVVLIVMFMVVLFFHCVLPRPEHAINRARRKSIRRQRKVGHYPENQGQYREPHQDLNRVNTPPGFPRGDYPQNFPEYYS